MKQKKPSERLEQDISGAVMILEAFLHPSPTRNRGTVVAHLMARVEMNSEVDGYSRGGDFDKTSGGSVSDPTGSAAFMRLTDHCERCKGGSLTLASGKVVTCKFCNGSGRRFADPVKVQIEEIVKELRVVCRLAKKIDKLNHQLIASPKMVERSVSLQGNCDVCEDFVTGLGEDRLKRGLDAKCYASWKAYIAKHQNPDPGLQYVQFKQWRRNNLAELNKRND